MKGATADPCIKTIRVPRRGKTVMIGNSQNFLASFMKAHSSMTNLPIRHLLSHSPPRARSTWSPTRQLRPYTERRLFDRGRGKGGCGIGLVVFAEKKLWQLALIHAGNTGQQFFPEQVPKQEFFL